MGTEANPQPKAALTLRQKRALAAALGLAGVLFVFSFLIMGFVIWQLLQLK